MNIRTIRNGIAMTATPDERGLIKKLLKIGWMNGYAKEAAFLEQTLRPQYQVTAACAHGHLTDAPMITDGIADFAFMDYQVTDFLGELAAGREVVWQKG